MLAIVTTLCSLTIPARAPQPPIRETIARATARVDAERLERSVRTLVGFGTRHVLSGGPVENGRGTEAARAWIEARFRECAERSGGRLRVERKSYRVNSRRLRREIEVVNLVATLPGVSDPERIYLVAGHYDSINGDPRDATGDAPGADDDGSGTAVVLEACRALCETELAATVMFVCYDGEEQGLLGSTAHAAELAARGARVDGMITNDIVGSTLGMDGVVRDDYVRCFSYAPRGNDSPGRSLARAATFAAREYVPDFRVRLVFRGDRYGRGGDHRPFHARGYPAIRFTEPREDYSRQHADVTERDGKPYGDLPDYMDFAYLARVCRTNVALLAELAAAPPAPRWVFARGARDAYDVLMQWTPSPGASGYEVVWRDTTAPDWTRARVVAPDELEQRRGRVAYRLRGVCLDDVVVGVRALGANGARSRVQTPPEPDAFGQRPARRRSK